MVIAFCSRVILINLNVWRINHDPFKIMFTNK